ncbi:hypothetical protein [Ammoniphilus sp. CFH 90114]|uniref:hypothetical protein n=1 Tax=Ammoniphilus sp. CFH 90114 TaxID=2493665 RepID=UPI00100FF087|nr:hypothetical protein [Ammoniphilus sp. CFH 90114]RXT03560.1 hypothetical protein EIZ39_23805 [Ammoniphilus sp. CFH 90114]
MLAVQEKITSSSLYQHVENSLQIINEIQVSEKLNSSEDREKLSIMFEALNLLKIRMDAADPVLVSNNSLTNMFNQINNLTGELNAFRSNKNTGHLDNAISKVEALLPFYSQINLPMNELEIEGIRDYIIKFRQSVGQHLSHLENEFEQVKNAHVSNSTKLNELSTSIESQKSRVDTVVSEFQTQFLQAQNQRLEDFSKEQNERNDDFIHKEKEREQLFEEMLGGHNEQLEKLSKEFSENASSTLTEIEDLKTKAEKIVSIIANSGVAGAYDETSKKEGWTALIWDLGSVLSLGLILYFGYKYVLTADFTWTQLVARLFLGGIGVTLFGYCARRATNHRNEQRRNRQIAIELASLDPYIESFEEKDQHDIKTRLVDKYFGRDSQDVIAQDPKNTSNNTGMDPAILNNQQFQQFVELLQQQMKNGK